MFKLYDNQNTNIYVTPENKNDLFTIRFSSVDKYGMHMPYQVYYNNDKSVTILEVTNTHILFKFEDVKNLKRGKVILASYDDRLEISYTPSENLFVPDEVVIDFSVNKFQGGKLYGDVICAINGQEQKWHIDTRTSVIPLVISKTSGNGKEEITIEHEGTIPDGYSAFFEIVIDSTSQKRRFYVKQTKVRQYLNISKKGDII